MPYVGCVLTEGKTVEERLQKIATAEDVTPPQVGHKEVRQRVVLMVVQIDEGNTPEQALEFEAWWIKRLGTMAPDGGYNLTAGGKGLTGHKHSEETRKKMSVSASSKVPDASWNNLKPHTAALNEYIKKNGSPRKGVKVSEETRKRISEGKKAYFAAHPEAKDYCRRGGVNCIEKYGAPITRGGVNCHL